MPAVKTHHVLVVLGVFAVSTLPHCSSRYAAYCDNARSCEGGNDRDVDACIEQQRALEEVSDAYDCEDQWDAFAKCLETLTCLDGRLDARPCEVPSKTWVDCTRNSSGRPKGDGRSMAE